MAGVLETLADMVGTVTGIKRKYNNATSPSLTAYTKQANVMSRLYIEDSILRDDICPPLVGVLNQLYVSYILSALNLDTMCANGRTVREQFEVVATENKDVIEDIIKNFGKVQHKPSMEAGPVVDTESITQRLPTSRVIELTMYGIQALNSTKEGEIDEHSERRSDGLKIGGNVNTSVSLKKQSGSETKSFGESEQKTYGENGRANSSADRTTVTNKDDEDTTSSMTSREKSRSAGWNGDVSHNEEAGSRKSNSGEKTKSETTYQFKAYLYVQLIPYVLLPEVVDGYIAANFAPPISVRWKQLKAGEISFWKDFIFALDLVKKQAKALKKDKHNILGDMLNRQHMALFKWWTDLASILISNRGSHNMANTMLITNKATFDRACRENRINFAVKTQRQKFFNKTWSMIICVVDPLYNTVEMYFNGIDVKGTYTFNMINKVGAKGQDNFDLKDVMSAFSQGLSPKF